ncbi:MAG TPA: molybdopterin dinucleotide binding domain-containing protein, partial [Chloroflexota bacterium]|nr:molybdopterin dinucleotide binding domain-containing protein [Chloroflexota bacterium]
ELGHDYGFRSAEAVWAEFNEIAQPLQMEGSGERQELVAPRSEANGDYPFLLATETDLFTAGGALRRGATMAGLYPAELQIAAADAQRLGIDDGDRVEVGNGAAKLQLPARVSDAVPAGVAYLPDYLAEAPARDLRPARPDAVPVAITRLDGEA